MVHRSDFTGPADLRAMQTFTARCWSPVSRFHPGQLAWNRYSGDADLGRAGDDETISLWSEGSHVVGFGWAQAQDWLELQVDPAFPEVADEVIDWFEDWSEAQTQSVLVMDGDVAEPALRRAGFEPALDEPFFTHHVLDLARLGPVSAVSGYTVRHVGRNEAAERARCHRAAWSQFGPSPVSATAYAGLMSTWPYRADLDWVAVDADAQMVASCLVWFDPASGVGLIEPVGVVPAHRGNGLARLVTMAALQHLRDLGARTAQVTPRGDDAYPGPQRLYRSLGFQPTARTVTWTRSLI